MQNSQLMLHTSNSDSRVAILSYALLEKVGLPFQGYKFHEVEWISHAIYFFHAQRNQQIIGNIFNVHFHMVGIKTETSGIKCT